MAWIFASVVLFLVASVPGAGRKIGILLLAAVLAFLVSVG